MIKWHPQHLPSLHFCSLLQWQRLCNQIMSFWSNSRPQRCKMKNTLSFDPTSKHCFNKDFKVLFSYFCFDRCVSSIKHEFILNRFCTLWFLRIWQSVYLFATRLLNSYAAEVFWYFSEHLNGIFIFREDMMWHVGSDTSPHVHRSRTHLLAW